MATRLCVSFCSSSSSWWVMKTAISCAQLRMCLSIQSQENFSHWRGIPMWCERSLEEKNIKLLSSLVGVTNSNLIVFLPFSPRSWRNPRTTKPVGRRRVRAGVAGPLRDHHGIPCALKSLLLGILSWLRTSKLPPRDFHLLEQFQILRVHGWCNFLLYAEVNCYLQRP